MPEYDPIATAERHVAEAERHVEQLHTIVLEMDELPANGRAASQARKVLGTLEVSLQLAREHLYRLQTDG